jgi:hypothetical protein
VPSDAVFEIPRGTGRARGAGILALALSSPALAKLRPTHLARALAWATASPRGTEAEAAISRAERALGISGRVYSHTCLTRGIVRFVALRRAGLPVDLVFGLGAPSGVADGHCWLELDGHPYLEREDPRSVFPEMYRLPLERRA